MTTGTPHAFTDTVRLDDGKVRRTADGYLVADALVARTGIQEYAGREVGRPDLPRVRVYRPEAEVFAADSMRSYAHRPVTNEHPRELVTAANWRDVARGITGDEVVRDGEFVRVPLVVMDEATINDYDAGKLPQISMGYTANIVFDSGTTPDGQPYDAVQTGLRMNHLALVGRARGGDKLRLGDDHPQGTPMTNEAKTRTVLVDGLMVETTDAGAIAIETLQRRLADATTAHATALATKDADIAKRDAEIDALKAKVLDAAALDARVNERATLIATARRIHDADYAGKTDAEIRKAAVVAKLGDAAVAGKPQAYIDARFDILAEDAKGVGDTGADPFRAAMRDHRGARQPVNDNGYAESVKALNAGSQYGKGAN